MGAEGRRGLDLTDWLGLMTPATVLGGAVFIWRVVAKAGDLAREDLAEAEKRIVANADKGHAATGESIDRLGRRAAAIKGGRADAGEDLAAL